MSYLPVLLTLEEDRQRDLHRAKVAQSVERLLDRAGWPFEDAKRGKEEPHPLSRKVITAVSDSCPLDEARRRLKEIRAERRAVGVQTPPNSRAFQRMKVIRVIARDLWTYLARCDFLNCHAGSRDWTRERVFRLSFAALKDAFSQTERHRLMVETVDLVNLAFPNVARLTPQRVWGSAPRTPRVDS